MCMINENNKKFELLKNQVYPESITIISHQDLFIENESEVNRMKYISLQ